MSFTIFSLIPKSILGPFFIIVFLLAFIKICSKSRNPQNKFHRDLLSSTQADSFANDLLNSIYKSCLIALACFILIALPLWLLLVLSTVGVSAHFINKMYYRQ